MPLTDEQRARIVRVRDHAETPECVSPLNLRDDIYALIAIIDALEADLAAARDEAAEWRGLCAELVERYLFDNDDHTEYVTGPLPQCIHCGEMRDTHRPDCPVGRAQAMLREVGDAE